MSRVCPNCENVISNDEFECPYCTGKLPNKDVDTIVNKRTCPRMLKQGICYSFKMSLL